MIMIVRVDIMHIYSFWFFPFFYVRYCYAFIIKVSEHLTFDIFVHITPHGVGMCCYPRPRFSKVFQHLNNRPMLPKEVTSTAGSLMSLNAKKLKQYFNQRILMSPCVSYYSSGISKR